MSSVGTTEAKIGDLLWSVRKPHETKRKSFGHASGSRSFCEPILSG